MEKRLASTYTRWRNSSTPLEKEWIPCIQAHHSGEIYSSKLLHLAGAARDGMKLTLWRKSCNTGICAGSTLVTTLAFLLLGLSRESRTKRDETRISIVQVCLFTTLVSLNLPRLIRLLQILDLLISQCLALDFHRLINPLHARETNNWTRHISQNPCHCHMRHSPALLLRQLLHARDDLMLDI